MKLKQFILVFLFSWTIGTLTGQNQIEFIAFFGPNLTNVHDFWFGERVFYASPERPYYKINLHGGIGFETPVLNKKQLKGRAAIFYERKGSSASGFNKETENHGDFLNIPISLMYRPLAEKEISLEFGTSFNLLVNNQNLIGQNFSSYEIPLVLGIELRLVKNIYFGVRWIEPLNYLGGNIHTLPVQNQVDVNWKQKTQSFQFSTIYKFKKL